MNILELSSVKKSYLSYSSQLKRVARFFGAPFRPISEVTVLEDISFTVKRGESIAIVGENGAGKSTLLKLITGTLIPTEGTIQKKGSISAILELGMGFNPDFTGRQNAYHAASLMGHSKKSIDSAISYIEEFAEIGDYFDKPTRIYSSGMQMRVAFAVATAFSPDLLIIDEALSVGDAYFQHKSFEKIRQFRDEGVSLLFVSHDRAAVQAVCDRALLLSDKKIVMDAKPQEVFDYYNALIAQKEDTKIHAASTSEGLTKTSSGTGEAAISSVLLRNCKGEKTDSLEVGEQVTLCVEVEVRSDIDSLVCGFLIKDRLGQSIFGTNTHHTGQALERLKAATKLTYEIEFEANLGEGSYSITVALTDSPTHLSKNYEWQEFAAMFDVTNTTKNSFIGTSWLRTNILAKKEPQ